MGIQLRYLWTSWGKKSVHVSELLRATTVALAITAATAIVISAAVTTRARAELGTFASRSGA